MLGFFNVQLGSEPSEEFSGGFTRLCFGHNLTYLQYSSAMFALKISLFSLGYEPQTLSRAAFWAVLKRLTKIFDFF